MMKAEGFIPANLGGFFFPGGKKKKNFFFFLGLWLFFFSPRSPNKSFYKI